MHLGHIIIIELTAKIVPSHTQVQFRQHSSNELSMVNHGHFIHNGLYLV